MRSLQLGVASLQLQVLLAASASPPPLNALDDDQVGHDEVAALWSPAFSDQVITTAPSETFVPSATNPLVGAEPRLTEFLSLPTPAGRSAVAVDDRLVESPTPLSKLHHRRALGPDLQLKYEAACPASRLSQNNPNYAWCYTCPPGNAACDNRECMATAGVISRGYLGTLGTINSIGDYYITGYASLWEAVAESSSSAYLCGPGATGGVCGYTWGAPNCMSSQTGIGMQKYCAGFMWRKGSAPPAMPGSYTAFTTIPFNLASFPIIPTNTWTEKGSTVPVTRLVTGCGKSTAAGASRCTLNGSSHYCQCATAAVWAGKNRELDFWRCASM
ncbi:hypothetical protein HDU90_008148, partial [Geranomyces variabilis]